MPICSTMAIGASPTETRIRELSRGFRDRYLDFDELTRRVHGWAEAFPDLVRVESIGNSREGRDLWLLTIGPDPDRPRPAVWIDGNMHASELCGSSVALAIAEDALAVHGGATPEGVPKSVASALETGVPASTDRRKAAGSAPGEPNTITCFEGRVPRRLLIKRWRRSRRRRVT